MTIWLYCLAAFFAGGLIIYLLSGFYIRKVLRYEKRAYVREMKKTVRFWYLKPFPLIEVLKRHKDDYQIKKNKQDSSIQDLSRKFEEAVRDLKIQQRRLEKLEKENHKLRNVVKSSVNSQKTSAPVQSDTGNKVDQTSGHGKIRNNALYFSIPETDGSFYNEKGETIQSERKFFCIIPGNEGENGELHFISGKFDQKAIENIDYYLIPVCEVENISLRNSASRIIQKEAGRVTKVPGKWIINNKIKVKLT